MNNRIGIYVTLGNVGKFPCSLTVALSSRPLYFVISFALKSSVRVLPFEKFFTQVISLALSLFPPLFVSSLGLFADSIRVTIIIVIASARLRIAKQYAPPHYFLLGMLCPGKNNINRRARGEYIDIGIAFVHDRCLPKLCALVAREYLSLIFFPFDPAR